MKFLLPVAAMLALADKAQAHVAEMPGGAHLAGHGWQLMAVSALAAVLVPRFRARR